MMASKSSNFLDGLEFYFITKKPDKVQRLEGTVNNRFMISLLDIGHITHDVFLAIY